MLSTLRAVAIIGAIFVLSPTREGPDRLYTPPALPPPGDESPLSQRLRPPSVDALSLERLTKLWGGLPNAARGLVATLVRRAETTPEDAISRQVLAGAKASRDTLRPEDRRPIWRGRESEPR